MDSTKDDAQTVTELPKEEQIGSVAETEIEDAVVGAAAPAAIEAMQETTTEKLKPLDPEQVLQAAIEETDTDLANEEEAFLESPLELPKDDAQPLTTESVKESISENPDDSQVKSETESLKFVQSEGDFEQF